jgi:DNA invertase Pin-like site-specific DNA recombinase
MSKVIGYLRVSTLKQEIESQKTEIVDYCKRNGFKVDRWVKVEMSSRKSMKERGIEDLLAKLKKDDTLIVSELSRLGRSIQEVVWIVNKLIDKKVKFIAIKQGLVINGENDMQTKVMVTMFSLFAELERDLISMRTKNGLVKAKQKGVKLGNPRDLREYDHIRVKKADDFAESLRSTLKGYIDQGMSRREIVAKLNELGIESRTGKSWHLSTLMRTLKRLELA